MECGLYFHRARPWNLRDRGQKQISWWLSLVRDTFDEEEDRNRQVRETSTHKRQITEWMPTWKWCFQSRSEATPNGMRIRDIWRGGLKLKRLERRSWAGRTLKNDCHTAVFGCGSFWTTAFCFFFLFIIFFLIFFFFFFRHDNMFDWPIASPSDLSYVFRHQYF